MALYRTFVCTRALEETTIVERVLRIMMLIKLLFKLCFLFGERDSDIQSKLEISDSDISNSAKLVAST